MSGGTFDYHQYYIGDIASAIEEELAAQKLPAPPTKKVNYISVRRQYDENSYISLPTYSQTIEGAKKEILNTRGYKKGIHIYDKYDTWEDKYGNTHPCKYIFIEKEYDEPIEGLEGYCYGEKYSEKTIAEFKKAVIYLKIAEIYAQRIDWLIACDDGEESFYKRLKEDLTKLCKEYDDILDISLFNIPDSNIRP